MFDILEYQQETRPIIFKLRGGKELRGEYFQNYMNEVNLEAFDKMADEADRSGDVNKMHDAYATHLSYAVAKVEIGKREGSKIVPMPCGTQEERYKIMRAFSYQDLRFMLAQITDDLNRPLDSDVTNLSDGPAPKEESEAAQKTKTDS